MRRSQYEMTFYVYVILQLEYRSSFHVSFILVRSHFLTIDYDGTEQNF